MADPISIASGILTLVAFSTQSAQSLYRTVQSLRHSQRNIRELKQELEALDGVLRSLEEATNHANVELQALKLPLYRCGQACKDFEAVILKCTTHSGRALSHFKDWARLTYMGEDINGFKNVISAYKSTIAIALGDANL